MSELNTQPMFFLGANSPKGFVSRFGESFSAKDGWHTYIIKGGPGTGKSTLMKRIADYFLKQNVRCRLCPCSSDPSSLDAVIFPDLKVAVLDGTSPHVVEPQYPGAVEEIINLGDYFNEEKLQKSRKAIITLTDANKDCHKRVSSYLSAAGCMIEDTAAIATANTDTEKAHNFGLSLAKKYIPKSLATPHEWVRYLSGVTPKGHIFYRKTLDKMCEGKIVIADEFGGASPIIMNAIRKYALNFGHEIISCYCPMQPLTKCEHIIIPSLRIGFCTSSKYHTLESDERIIHARRFMDIKSFHLDRQRITFNRKAVAELIGLASDTLLEAKAIHDELESCYIEAMDFEGINAETEQLVHKIIKLAIKKDCGDK